jgi:guanylate kinase
VVERLKQEGWEMVVTHNAGRDPRPGEVDGVHYHFVSRTEFERMAGNGELLEYVEYAETKKGTSRVEIETKLALGKKVIWRIDPTAAARVKEILAEGLREKAEEIIARTRVVFLLAEGEKTLLERAKKRNRDGKTAEIKRRIREDNLAWKKLKDRFEHVVVNRDGALEETVAAVKAIANEPTL